MQQEKKRPTLEELESMPVELRHLEVAQLCHDAAGAGQDEILEEAELLLFEPGLAPEKIVELWQRLRCATGSTEMEIETAAPTAQSDAA